MISYNDIYEAARKERYSDQLQPLNKSFVEEVSKYFEEKKKSFLNEHEFSDTAIKTKKQLENAMILFRELMTRRRKKILNLVLIASETGLSKRDSENMLPFEKELFEDIMNAIGISDKRLNELMNGKTFEDEKNALVLFREDISEFVGMDGSKIGPFKKGDMANLPKEIAKILITDQKAELITLED